MKNDLKVIITIGIAGSGKSTWAKNFINKNQNWVRVNRDDLRKMLTNMPICEPHIESLITEISNKLIIKALLRGQNVIIDNTHLKQKYIDEQIELVKYYADIEFLPFETSVSKCIERDSLRKNPIGEHLIQKMFIDYTILMDSFDFTKRKKVTNFPVIRKQKSMLQEAVIFDIDGTLTHMGQRGAYEWNKVDRDEVNSIVVEHIKFHKDLGRKIIILTGRDEICRELTIEWLVYYQIYYDLLLMRSKDDRRKDSIVKRELYNEYIKSKFNLICLYDDRLSVLDMWNNEGIFTFNVNQGNREF